MRICLISHMITLLAGKSLLLAGKHISSYCHNMLMSSTIHVPNFLILSIGNLSQNVSNNLFYVIAI